VKLVVDFHLVVVKILLGCELFVAHVAFEALDVLVRVHVSGHVSELGVGFVTTPVPAHIRLFFSVGPDVVQELVEVVHDNSALFPVLFQIHTLENPKSFAFVFYENVVELVICRTRNRHSNPQLLWVEVFSVDASDFVGGTDIVLIQQFRIENIAAFLLLEAGQIIFITIYTS